MHACIIYQVFPLPIQSGFDYRYWFNCYYNLF